MVRVVGGVILTRIGFELFSGSSSGARMIQADNSGDKGNIAFVPLAIPLMCGPGAIATIIGMASLVKHSEFEFFAFLAIACAILVTMLVTYLCLAYAQSIFSTDWALGY
jgi:multiple antibiotic resistance protein